LKDVLVDTYALLAAATGGLTPAARSVFSEIRKGREKGLIHALIVYETLYHWRRGRLPLFENEDELFKYLTSVFGVVKFSEGTARKAAEVKAAGDEMLKRAPDPSLRARRLSACDAFTIAVALDRALPVLSGDKDLVYVASGLGVRVVW
jgi:predicted nucleic acid-binding protein